MLNCTFPGRCERIAYLLCLLISSFHLDIVNLVCYSLLAVKVHFMQLSSYKIRTKGYDFFVWFKKKKKFICKSVVSNISTTSAPVLIQQKSVFVHQTDQVSGVLS